MRKLVLAAALASAMSAMPAMARDNSPYVGIEGGALRAQDTNIDYEVGDEQFDDALRFDHKWGLDVDLIGGYDFGAFGSKGSLGTSGQARMRPLTAC